MTVVTAVAEVATHRAPIVSGVRALRNNPCNVKLTIEVEGRPERVYTLDDENDARNFLARMIPTPILMASPDLVMPHINDGTAPVFNNLLEDAKALGLDLPAGI